MNKNNAPWLTLLFASAFPAIASAQNVCELLTVGAPNLPPPNPVTADPPDISKLIIQVYTTRPLEFIESDATLNHTHRCAIARDLAEVDVMTQHIGFGGYTPNNVNPTNAPLFTNAFVRYLASPNERQQIREVAKALVLPEGRARERLEALKNTPTLYDARVLNVYFVDDVDLGPTDLDVKVEVKGMHIRNDEGGSENMIFYGDAALPGTLAHEFGHAFSGGHVNFLDIDGNEWCTKYLPYPGTSNPMINMECEFDQHNYMWGGSEVERDVLGDPQKERMLRNEWSIISQFSPPPDARKLACSDYNSGPGKDGVFNTEDDCPRLTQ